MNLIGAGRGPVLLDWTFAGPGAIGGDVAFLALDGFVDGLLEVELLDEVLESVTDAYVRGLAGVVAPEVVRRAIRVTGAARYFWMAPRRVAAAGTVATTNGYTYDERDAAERFAARAPIFRVLADWSDTL